MARGVHFAEYPLQGVVVRQAKPEDAYSLAGRLRKADEAEVTLGGLLPLEALLHGLEGLCLTIALKGLPIAMFGVNPDPNGNGVIWLLGSPEIESIRWLFLRESRGWLERIGEGFPLLYNAVMAENTLHVRWLAWLGFTFLRSNGPLLEFVRIV